MYGGQQGEIERIRPPHTNNKNRLKSFCEVGYANFRPNVFSAGKRISMEILVGVGLHAMMPSCIKKLADVATVRSFAHMPLWLSHRNITNLFTMEIILAISLTIACSRYIYNGVILHAHPVRGESHNQRNAIGEVATLAFSKNGNVQEKYLSSL